MEEMLDKFEKYLGTKKKPYISKVMSDLDLKEYEVLGLIEILKQKG